MTRLTALLLTAPLLGGPLAVQAQQRCADGMISQVHIQTRDPWDAGSTSEEATFGWAFRALNWLHVDTREAVVAWELLFAEGDCFDPLRLSESERKLRALRFLRSASVTHQRLDDGSWRVDVDTRDSWALSASLGIDFEGGLAVTGVQASYHNVLGSGLRTSLFQRSFRERLREGLLARHGNLFGTGIDVVAHGGRTRAGDYLGQAVEKPFLDEFGDHGLRQAFVWRDDYFGYSLPPDLGFTPAYLRYHFERYELTWQTRLGPAPGRRALLGLGLSSESFSTAAGPEGVRAVVDGDYGETVDAPDVVRDALARQAAPFSTRRVTAYVGVRDIRFAVRRGIDAVDAAQDVPVGADATLAVSPGFAVSAADHSDVLGRLQGRLGLLGASHYLQTRLDVQARRVLGESPGPGGWRDILASLRTDAYWTQAEGAGLHVRARMAGGWRTDRPFQLRLGGREWIRAYSEDAFPGGRLLFASAEQRLALDAISPGFADLGAAAFVDAGRMWAGDAPFGLDSGWQAGVGVGLRASSSGARRVLRFDATLPLTSQRSARGVTFRIHAEIFGVLDRRRWPDQLQRSRWYGSDPDLSARVPDPLARN